MFRTLRVIKSGIWCAPAIVDARFADDGSDWAERVAVDLGFEPGALEVVDAEEDPRDTPEEERVGYVPPEPEPEPEPDHQAVLLESLAAEWRDAAANLRSNKPDAAATALERAAGVAEASAERLKGQR